ncbi:MAG: TIGR00282 family metallophosphoesterase [Candidatus Sumerlaeia bacterium]|nr:TIGR00282 family metallophosphoesterase [Candidatus Sumerlaeia bacterium]
MNILFIGDLYGRPGRDALKKALPGLMKQYAPDMVIANGENVAGGKGITEKLAREIFDCGVDVITGGNHSFHQQHSDDLHAEEERLLRPENFPPGTPGHGWTVYNSSAGHPVCVMNVCGRSFMNNFDDPFRAVDRMLKSVRDTAPVILLDFHAETTSEKVAMGWYLDGRVTAVMGTHTHIQTADERILPGGTAYITDVGMTGPYDSVIGAEKNAVIESLLTLRPKRFEVAPPNDVRLCGVFVQCDPLTGRAERIERVCVALGNFEE